MVRDRSKYGYKHLYPSKYGWICWVKCFTTRKTEVSVQPSTAYNDFHKVFLKLVSQARRLSPPSLKSLLAKASRLWVRNNQLNSIRDTGDNFVRRFRTSWSKDKLIFNATSQEIRTYRKATVGCI